MDWIFESPKPTPQRLTSSNKSVPPNSSQVTTLSNDHAIPSYEPVGGILIQTTIQVASVYCLFALFHLYQYVRAKRAFSCKWVKIRSHVI